MPGVSSVPANNEPIITASAPAAKALARSPEYLIPPSEIIFTFLFLMPPLTFKIALNWGTPIPATNLVVQIEPGPIPTLITSTPALSRNFAASGVAIFPAHKAVFLFFFFFMKLIISKTFLLWPWAVSTTIISKFSFNRASALLTSLGPAPTAAPTSNLNFFTFLTSLTCFFTSKFLWIIPKPPAFAIAIAILLSVTVSIAEDKSGILSFKNLVSLILVSTSDGNTSEYLGAKVTSSKVSASFIGTIIIYIWFLLK